MKKLVIFSLAATVIFAACDVLKSAATDVANEALSNVANGKPAVPSLTSDEAAGGLKEALINGVINGTGTLGKVGAFATSPSIKILLPAEVQNIEKKIRDNYLLNAAIGKELDKTIDAMNAGAEKSMQLAVPVFKKAITNTWWPLLPQLLMKILLLVMLIESHQLAQLIGHYLVLMLPTV
jgi:hypothetical protein